MLVTAVEKVSARTILYLACPVLVRRRQQHFVPVLNYPLSLRFRESGAGGGERRRGDPRRVSAAHSNLHGTCPNDESLTTIRK
jgi:hypothetical protein